MSSTHFLYRTGPWLHPHSAEIFEALAPRLPPSRPWELFRQANNHCPTKQPTATTFLVPTRYPFIPGPRECTYRWSALLKDTASHRGNRDPHSRVTGSCHGSTTPRMYMEYKFGYRDNEGGHYQGACRFQWFFYVPLNVSETVPPFTWSCEPEEIYTRSPELKGEK